MLDSLCEHVGSDPFVVLMCMVVVVLSVIVLLSQYSELNCEENKLEVGLFAELYSPTPK